MNRNRARCGVLALAAGVALLGGFGCKKNSSSSGSRPLSVTISPSGTNPRTTFDLTANANISTTGPTPVYTFSWTVDGVDAGISSNVVPKSTTVKHETWEVTVFADVGGTVSGPVTDSVTIVNTPPVITTSPIRILPTNPRRTGFCSSTDLSVTVSVTDDDGDPVTLTYSWEATPTGAPPGTLPTVLQTTTTASTTSTLSSSLTTPGDQLRVRVTPRDDEVDGPFAISPANRNTIDGSCLTGTIPPGSPGGDGSAEAAQAQALLAPSAPADASGAGGAALARPISIGESNVCSIGADGALVCTGDETTGVTEAPAGRYLQVAVGLDYACAIGADDLAIRCWGAPPEDSGLLAAPEGAFVQLGLGVDAACALRASGEVACWGAEDSPQAAAPEGRFLYLDVSDTYACAIDEDGAVLCWGE